MRDRILELRRVPAADVEGLETACLAAAERGCRVAISGYSSDWPEIGERWTAVEWGTDTSTAGGISTPRTEVLRLSYEPDLDRLAAIGLTTSPPA